MLRRYSARDPAWIPDLGHRAHRGTGCVGARLDGGQHGADRAAPGLRRQVRRQSARAIRLLVLSGALMAVCCGFFAMAQAASATFAILAILAAVVVLSVAENIQEVAAWELSAELSPEAARARYLGAFSLGFSGQKVIGPTLLVVVLMPTGLIASPALAGAFGAAALISRTAARRGLAERTTLSSARLSSVLPTHQPKVPPAHQPIEVKS